ncbi:MAG: Gfo/Idh/MocA family oxidoreductase [Candidatus Bipolaricaulota bacterium]|nr:Gfo/Idh/MocA family oxidoreductase [Candidatus Bipolaricaulota bacterium]
MNYYVGLVGTGAAAELHASALDKVTGATLEAVCSRTKKNGAEFAKKWNIDYFSDFKKLISLEKIDFISICTPTGTHSQFAIPAAEAGKNLVIEKPLETTPERCDKILNAAEKHGIQLSVIFQNRFKSPVKRIKGAVEEGNLGQLVIGKAEINWYRSEDYYSNNWKGTKKYDGGGALINQGIHTIDLLQWMLGKVVKVNGNVKILKHEIEGEDAGVATLEFAHGGLGIVTGSTAVYPGLEEHLGLYGTQGSIELKGNKITTWETSAKDTGRKPEGESSEAGTSGASAATDVDSKNHQTQWREILDRTEKGGKPPVSGREARKSVEIINAIYKSSRIGQNVTIDNDYSY